MKKPREADYLIRDEKNSLSPLWRRVRPLVRTLGQQVGPDISCRQAPPIFGS